MKRRRLPVLFGFLFGLAAIGLGTPAAHAGGVVVSLDEEPGQVEAGRPFVVAFTITSMHGTGPVSGAEPSIVFVDRAGGQRIVLAAEAGKGPGQYVAEATLPSGGDWSWRIHPYGETGDYPASEMSPLAVGGPAVSAAQVAAAKADQAQSKTAPQVDKKAAQVDKKAAASSPDLKSAPVRAGSKAIESSANAANADAAAQSTVPGLVPAVTIALLLLGGLSLVAWRRGTVPS
jgi:hypothetical protein